MEFVLPSNEGKMRIVQELVPGKQVTLAHIIASPDEIVYKKLGLNPALDYSKAAIGILSMSPAEISVIAGDMAVKTANIDLGFIDRFSGTLIFTGRVAEVEEAAKAADKLPKPKSIMYHKVGEKIHKRTVVGIDGNHDTGVYDLLIFFDVYHASTKEIGKTVFFNEEDARQ